ncbi:MAG: S8 family peptidase [Burkholderiaceae bacterium]
MQITSFRRSITALGLSLLAAAAAAAASSAWSAERGPLRRAPSVQPAETEARVIVKFKADSSVARAFAVNPNATHPMQAQTLSSRLGLQLSDGHALGPRIQVLTAKGIGSRELAARLSAQSDVEYAEADERMRALAAPNDPLYRAALSTSPAAGQWYLQAPNSTLVSAVNAEAAWAITTGRSSVVVAVLDTGIRPNHPDLAGKLLPGYDFITNALNANDGDGRDNDPSDPGDWVEAADINVVPGCTSTSDIGDSIWHGTQTAGLIGAATNNGIGMASMGRDVKILPVRVLGKCGGLSSDIQAAMLWSAGLTVSGVPTNPNPAKVINLSLGSASTTCSQSYQDAVNAVVAVGVVVVAAAGNEGLAVGSPANCTGVIGVAGVRHSGTKVGYSNLGSTVSISAPAGNCFNSAGACLYPLLTTSNTGTKGPVADNYTDGINDLTLGTSFSAPLVAGTAALMFSVNSGLTPAQVLSALKSTARAFPADQGGASVRACTAPTPTAQPECYCTTSTCGAGLLDAGAAVAAVGSLWATIAVAPAYPLAGRSIVLSGVASTATGSAASPTYSWQILGGAAAFSGRVDQPTANLVPSAPGSVVARLAVTDSVGRSAVSVATLSVSGAPMANIVLTSSSPIVGQTVALDGSSSEASPTGSLIISGYQWTITGGGGNASFVGIRDASTASILTSAAGNVTVTLTVTDSAGQQSTTSKLIAVSAAAGTPVTPVTPAPSSGGGGGGGALNLEWLLTLVASTLALHLASRRQRRQAARVR